jgi:hypothetical protein
LRLITENILGDVQPPTADNAASHALTIISDVLHIGGLSGAVCQPCGAVANGLGAVFGIAAYLTSESGTPELIGPEVTAKSSELGQQLYDRYQAASDYLETEAKIVMSDWSKMKAVAEVAFSRDPWKPGDTPTVGEQLRLGTQQAIYQALVPVAYPVLYDLGTGITDARSWICKSVPTFLYDKRLFQHTEAGAQITWKMTNAPYVGQSHLFAVGARHTVGSLHDAYIQGPPDSLTAKMFNDPTDSTVKGVGMYRIQLYSPQNFRLFPTVFQQTNPADNGYGYWTCQDMPDPPGNAES